MKYFLNMPKTHHLWGMQLTTRSFNVIVNIMRAESFDEVVRAVKERRLIREHNCGRKSVQEIEEEVHKILDGRRGMSPIGDQSFIAQDWT